MQPIRHTEIQQHRQIIDLPIEMHTFKKTHGLTHPQNKPLSSPYTRIHSDRQTGR